MAKHQNGMPDWAKWRLIPNPQVWEAVALSLNIDPDWVQQSPSAWMGWRTGGLQESENRLRIACANYWEMNGEQPGADRADVSRNAKVSLSRFVRWAQTVAHWDMPSELSNIDGRQERVSVKGEGDCQRELEKLMLANRAAPDRKVNYRRRLCDEHSISARGFDRAWANAIKNTGNTAWAKAGAKKKNQST